MLKNLSGSTDIIIASVSGYLDKQDIERIMERLDAAFALGGKVHIFAEVTDFAGMPPDAWISDISHALRYLTRLNQFGRIAIVSNQNWIRTASRIESALLPLVSYEVYPPEQRDHALAWVKGESDTPHPAAVSITSDQGITTLKVSGRITRESGDVLRSYLADATKSGVALKILTDLRGYDGFDLAMLLDPRYLEVKLMLLRHVSCYAVLGGPEWMKRIVELSAPLLHMQLRHFDANEEQAALHWLGEGRKGEAA
ncbi:STAS/SEC14 domain-containing protein [Sphingomonas lycopersici]|uniref:STAS/SEC14 domain-containing protein n=1 Tax=Sphingomonas lycopersici TaxID=2951807 RepID=A0AA41ZAY8_9SPHN|nr:STAS/SEC14 domain-containing protein [Sphingomonas lycopersici]MCW6536007.1 STAS/SEC14 domain-containing protein [Sphingomonas lycopersici]